MYLGYCLHSVSSSSPSLSPLTLGHFSMHLSFIASTVCPAFPIYVSCYPWSLLHAPGLLPPQCVQLFPIPLRSYPWSLLHVSGLYCLHRLSSFSPSLSPLTPGHFPKYLDYCLHSVPSSSPSLSALTPGHLGYCLHLCSAISHLSKA
ncbi:hypothetical protein PoB_006143400 [Plakobranchus ocellatus]|uniref:Uncharacterized protein n=1 Tax=Plakobranchus ocellatus TaxID=259542 RepID=A0AAV4CSU7_9GAST|nr:hypothetical protein PoB_006143400 [Plakobranchus ocellatus]